MSWTFLSWLRTPLVWGPGGMKPRHESDDYSIPKVKLGGTAICTSWDASDGFLVNWRSTKCPMSVPQFLCSLTCLLTWWHGFFKTSFGSLQGQDGQSVSLSWNANKKTVIWRRCNWESKDWYLDLPFWISISSVLLSSPQCAKCSGNMAGQGRVYMHTQWAARLQHGMFAGHGYFVSESDSTLHGESPVNGFLEGL